MSKKESKIFYGWWIVLVCTLGLFVAYGARLYSFGVFFKPMVKEFGWTRTQTSSAFGVSTILYGVISPFVGKIVDKYGARFVIAIGGFIGGIGFMLCYFTNTLTQFFIFYTVIMTVGISMTGMVSTNAGVVKWFTKKKGDCYGNRQCRGQSRCSIFGSSGSMDGFEFWLAVVFRLYGSDRMDTSCSFITSHIEE